MTHVLVIEPNLVLARVYKRALEHAGYRCTVAMDAQGAIDAADDHRPDVILLELRLGSADGIEFLHEFRSYPEWIAIPVVVNTIIPPTVMASLLRPLQKDLGVTACLYKPQVSLHKLLTVVAGLA